MLSTPEQHLLAPTIPAAGRPAGGFRPSSSLLEPWLAHQPQTSATPSSSSSSTSSSVSSAVMPPAAAVHVSVGATGVWTSSEIPPDIVIGPHDESVLRFGDHVIEEALHPTMTEVKFQYGRLVDASDSHSSRWVWSLAAARHDHEQNLTAEVRADGLVVFRTTRHVLKGEELRVWFSPDLSGKLCVPAHVGCYEDEDGFFVCPVCAAKFRFPNALKSHLRSCRTTPASIGSRSVRPSPRSDRDRPEAEKASNTATTSRLGSAFRRVTPRSLTTTSSSYTTSATTTSSSSVSSAESSDVIVRTVKRIDVKLPKESNHHHHHHPHHREGKALTSKSSDVEIGSAFKPHTKTNASAIEPLGSARGKVGFRAFRKTTSPTPTTRLTETTVTSTMSSVERTRKESGVLFSVDKMLNHTSSNTREEQSPSIEAIKSPPGLDKNANPFDPLALRSQLSIPTGIAQFRPLDPYAHLPIRCFQPVIPTISRYGSILPAAHHHRGFYNGTAHPYFPYKVPIPTPLKFVHPSHPIPPPGEIDLPKFAGLDRTQLPLQAASSSFQVGETQYAYLQDSSRKNKRGHLCIYCGKLYSRKYGLKIHLRTHTGYKPLKCKVCLRPFGDPSNLNKHIRLHAEGDTPYRCEHCGKVLVRRRDLDRHIRSRHPAEAKKRAKEEETTGADSDAKVDHNIVDVETSHTSAEEGDDEEMEDEIDVSPSCSPDQIRPSPFDDVNGAYLNVKNGS